MIATDSHTPMINALGILGWGVGGLEGRPLVGEPVTLRFPDVVGIRLTGKLSAGVTDSDLALHITRLLRQHGVVGKFVEFTGPALAQMSVESRATIANMAPEYGATVVLFLLTDAATNICVSPGAAKRIAISAGLIWRVSTCSTMRMHRNRTITPLLRSR